MPNSYYVANCLFTPRYPKTSQKILDYISRHKEITAVRCCIPCGKVTSYSQIAAALLEQNNE